MSNLHRESGDGILESVAKAIYAQWAQMDGYKAWVEHGNSDKQEEARRIARMAINSARQAEAHPTPVMKDEFYKTRSKGKK